MHFVGIIVFFFIILIAIGLGVAGIFVFKRGKDWLMKSFAIILSVLGAVVSLTLIIGLITQQDPFTAVFIQIAIAAGVFIMLFWIAMLVEAALYEQNNNERLLWVIIIIFTQLIGALIYAIARRPRRISETGK